MHTHMHIHSTFRFPNVVILTTSNVTGAIDLAFVDRLVSCDHA